VVVFGVVVVVGVDFKKHLDGGGHGVTQSAW
jgi:hypothetical protein